MNKILIIDDEPQIRKMLKKLLESKGYITMEAGDGKEGIKIFNTYHPDLIIIDLIMPEKEGLETIKEIKQKSTGTKIIAISGGGLGNPKMYLRLASKIGANYSMTKPVDNAELLLKIDQLLDN